MKNVVVLLVCCLLMSVSMASANTIISGDLSIRDGGDLVFSDGSVQSKAQLQGPKGDAGPQGIQGVAGPIGATGAAAPPLTLASICAAITAGGASLPTFCPLPPITDPTTGMTLQRVTGGTFAMGDTFGDGSSNELPVHQVTVGDFYIGTYDVTQGQWQTVMGSNPSHFTACGTSCPVEQVSWSDIQIFIAILNQRSGKNYRLPTEAEWEYAARSGGKSEEYSGGNDVTAVAWYSANSGNTTHPVCQKQANGLGLYDMSGNVSEWVSDWFGSYAAAAQVNPQGPITGSYRVIRGGSWARDPVGVRASIRNYGGSGSGSGTGFRLVAPVQ